jgi:hypothetical protein
MLGATHPPPARRPCPQPRSVLSEDVEGLRRQGHAGRRHLSDNSAASPRTVRCGRYFHHVPGAREGSEEAPQEYSVRENQVRGSRRIVKVEWQRSSVTLEADRFNTFAGVSFTLDDGHVGAFHSARRGVLERRKGFRLTDDLELVARRSAAIRESGRGDRPLARRGHTRHGHGRSHLDHRGVKIATGPGFAADTGWRKTGGTAR